MNMATLMYTTCCHYSYLLNHYVSCSTTFSMYTILIDFKLTSHQQSTQPCAPLQNIRKSDRTIAPLMYMAPSMYTTCCHHSYLLNHCVSCSTMFSMYTILIVFKLTSHQQTRQPCTPLQNMRATHVYPQVYHRIHRHLLVICHLNLVPVSYYRQSRDSILHLPLCASRPSDYCTHSIQTDRDILSSSPPLPISKPKKYIIAHIYAIPMGTLSLLRRPLPISELNPGFTFY